MRLLLAVACLFVSAVACAQTATFGKTNSQILAMGREKWFDFYTSKAGQSTLGMADAERYYGLALAERNNVLLRKQSKNRQTLLSSVRKRSGELGERMVLVGMAYSGGGTMWTPVLAGIKADSEELLYALLKGGKLTQEEKKAPAFEALEKKLAKMGTDLAAAKKQISSYDTSEGELYKQAVRAQNEAKGILKTLLLDARKLRSSERARVASFVAQMLGIPEQA